MQHRTTSCSDDAPRIGVAILPCYVGDQDPEPRRIVGHPIVDGMMDL